RKLLTLLPRYPNAEIEVVLLDCLDSPDLRGSAAKRLGEYGAIRSTPRLREILAEAVTTEDRWDKAAAAHALDDLRDDPALTRWEKVAAEHSDGWVVLQAIGSLGWIGNSEAESSLGRLLGAKKDEGFENAVLEALLCCGSPAAVAQLVRRAAA